MGFDRKDIQVCVWNVLNFSGRALLTCVKKYPFVSCVLFLFFFLYMFFPAAFSLLIYSIPLVGFAALVHRVFLDIDCQKIACLKDDWTPCRKHGSVVEDDHVITRNSGARRRNAKQDPDEKFARASVEDKGGGSSASFNDDLVDKSALVEGNPKETPEAKAGSVTDKLAKGSSSSVSKKYGNSGKGEEWGGSFDNSEEEDDDEDEEEAHEEAERNEAVEWTEDDQKNLMDLGLSEIERNKRLESLIARRRSRKMLSFQVRKTVAVNNFIGQNIPSLQIPKMTNPFLAESSSSNLLSPGPGSAPSVLLPMRNPFDLPYDPLEEKPNLTGDSFHQEFMAAHQKEMMYCRHESFITKGAFLPPERLNADKHETSFYNGSVLSRGKTISPISIGSNALACKQGGGGFSDQVLAKSNVEDQFHHQEDDQDGNSEAGQIPKEMVVPDVTSGRSSRSSSSSSNGSKPPLSLTSANRDETLSCLNFAAQRKEFPTENDNISEVLMDGNPSKNVDDSDSTIRAGQVHADDFFYTGDNKLGFGHTPSNSIASDLQVEVSEVGSPPLTNTSSQDEEESSSINDADGEIIDKDGTNVVAAYVGDHDEETSDHLSTGLVLDENNHESITDADPLIAPAETVEEDTIPLLSPALTVDSLHKTDGIGPEHDATHEIIQSPTNVPILTDNVHEVTDELVANESHHSEQDVSQMEVSSSAQNETNIVSTQDSRETSEVERALSDQRDIGQEISDSELLASNLSDGHFVPQVELSDSVSESSRDHHIVPSEEPGLPTQFQFGAEQLVPTIISNSPKSVLQPEFSLDGTSNFSGEIQTLQAQQSDTIRVGDGDSTSQPENLTQAALLDVAQFLDINPVEERDLSNVSTSRQAAPLGMVQYLDINPVEEKDLSNDSTSRPENLTQAAPLDMVQYLDINPVEERDLSNSQEPPSRPGGETKEESTNIHPPIQALIIGESIDVHPLDTDRPLPEMSTTVESTIVLPPNPGMLIQEESIATNPPLEMTEVEEPIAIPPPTATSTIEESITTHPPLDTSTMEES